MIRDQETLEALLDSVRRFVRERLVPAENEVSETDEIPEAIVQEMESGKLPLEEALARYQRGVGLLRFCQGTLADAEQRVKVLEGETLIDFAGEGKQP